MPAVSNTSPIVLYDKIDHLWILRALYDVIHLPLDVLDEIEAGRSRHASGLVALQERWIVTHDVSLPIDMSDYASVDRGERAAIHLARGFEPAVDVLLDDRAGRGLARRFGLNVVGSAGVLVLAKKQGLIPAVEPLLRGLQDVGLRLGDAAFREALELSGETSR